MRRTRTSTTVVLGVVALLLVGAVSRTGQKVVHAADNWSVQNFPDCATPTSEFCVETLGFTAEGSTTEVKYADAVPNSSPAPSHPNTYVQLTPLFGGSVYGKSLSTMQFGLTSPASTRLGPVTETGIPAGTYRFVVRTGQYRPHSMTMKGRPSGDTPFKVTKESDGTYLLEITATAEAFVFSMDLTSCRNDAAICEASNAFVKTLQGLVYLVPPDFTEISSPVSPGVDVSQGLWIASNSTIRDVQPEMNLITKALSLPAYGPHYVPTDFPTAGLTADGTRYLNPAYFDVFVPTALASFMANYTPQEIMEKVPEKIKATIEKAGKEEPAQHTLTLKTGGGLVTVKLDHYSAPNPRVYVGAKDDSSVAAPTATTTTTTLTTPGFTTTTPATSAGSATGVSIKRKASIVLRTVAQKSGMPVAGARTITGTVISSSASKCRISAGRLVGLSAGKCQVRITVTTSTKKKIIKTVTVTVT